MKRTALLALATAALTLVGAARNARAQSPFVTLSLDLFFTNAQDNAEGGSWQLLAKGSHEGLAEVSTQLVGTRGASDAVFRAATNPGFRESIWNFDVDGDPATLDMNFAQLPLPAPGPQNLLYGAGVTTNNPDELGMIVDKSGVNMNHAMVMAFGTFAPGSTPMFSPGASAAAVFTKQGTTTDPPPQQSILDALVTTQIRTNVQTIVGDADLDFITHGAEFGIVIANFNKRDALWQQGDVDGDLTIGNSDFGVIIANFGTSVERPTLHGGVLRYDPATGHVVLELTYPPGAAIIGYGINSNGAFISDPMRTRAFPDSAFTYINNAHQVAELDSTFAGTTNPIDLKQLLPAGLTAQQVDEILTQRSFQSHVGSYAFKIVIDGQSSGDALAAVPEPASLALAAFVVAGIVGIANRRLRTTQARAA